MGSRSLSPGDCRLFACSHHPGRPGARNAAFETTTAGGPYGCVARAHHGREDSQLDPHVRRLVPGPSPAGWSTGLSTSSWMLPGGRGPPSSSPGRAAGVGVGGDDQQLLGSIPLPFQPRTVPSTRPVALLAGKSLCWTSRTMARESDAAFVEGSRTRSAGAEAGTRLIPAEDRSQRRGRKSVWQGKVAVETVVWGGRCRGREGVLRGTSRRLALCSIPGIG
jgi:hypothetical protein